MKTNLKNNTTLKLPSFDTLDRGLESLGKKHYFA